MYLKNCPIFRAFAFFGQGRAASPLQDELYDVVENALRAFSTTSYNSSERRLRAGGAREGNQTHSQNGERVMPVQPRLASTVMLLRNAESGPAGIEVFMVQRAVQSEFMPNLYVFPGGSVSADDHRAEETAGLCKPIITTASDPEGRTALGSGARAAAIRELFEEANVLLAYRDGQMLTITDETAARFTGYRQTFNERKGSLIEMAQSEHLVLATDHLAYFAHWITPEGLPKRYDTHFFLATAPLEQEAAYDQLETSDGVWIRPADALDRFKRREIPIAFPTFHQLRDLSAFHTVQEALDAAALRHVATHMPILTQKDGKPHVYLPEDADNAWKI